MKYYKHFRITQLHRLALVALIFLTYQLLIPAKISAISIGEEYSASDVLADGVLVSVDQNDPTLLEPTNMENDEYFFGVVQDSNVQVLTISKTVGETSVAISGEVSLLASDVNGDIKQGDLVGISWIDGVAMKLLEKDKTRIVGVALEDFSVEEALRYSGIETPTKESTSVNVGYIKIRLAEGTAFSGGYLGDPLTSSSTGFFERLAGKDVSTLRLVLGSLIFSISVSIVGMFIYSSLRNSFISFGRNPLASNSIYFGLFQISITSVSIITVGSLLAYFVWVV